MSSKEDPEQLCEKCHKNPRAKFLFICEECLHEGLREQDRWKKTPEARAEELRERAGLAEASNPVVVIECIARVSPDCRKKHSSPTPRSLGFNAYVIGWRLVDRVVWCPACLEHDSVKREEGGTGGV